VLYEAGNAVLISQAMIDVPRVLTHIKPNLDWATISFFFFYLVVSTVSESSEYMRVYQEFPKPEFISQPKIRFISCLSEIFLNFICEYMKPINGYTINSI
jgi:hypothetical protein